jgi:hypothetical protein
MGMHFVKPMLLVSWLQKTTLLLISTDISTGVIFKDAPQTAGTSDDIQIVLNEGESYVLAAYLDEPGATNNVNGVNGTHITSDKDIVVNTGSWLGGNAPGRRNPFNRS